MCVCVGVCVRRACVGVDEARARRRSLRCSPSARASWTRCQRLRRTSALPRALPRSSRGRSSRTCSRCRPEGQPAGPVPPPCGNRRGPIGARRSLCRFGVLVLRSGAAGRPAWRGRCSLRSVTTARCRSSFARFARSCTGRWSASSRTSRTRTRIRPSGGCSSRASSAQLSARSALDLAACTVARTRAGSLWDGRHPCCAAE